MFAEGLVQRTPVGFAALALALWPAVVVGQGVARSDVPAARPAVVRFAEDGVTLEEAARLTIAHNPRIQQAEAEAARQAGVAQEEAGPFDLSFALGAGYDSRVQALAGSQVISEDQRRLQLAASADEFRAGAAATARLIALLREIQGLPPGSVRVSELAALDAALGAQLQALDALAAGAPASAQTEILRARQDFIASTLSGLNRALEQSQALASSSAESLSRAGQTPRDERFDSASLKVEVSKVFRNGIALAPFLEGALARDRYVGKPVSVESGGLGVEDTVTLRAGAGITVPLRRGHGKRVVGATEDAARLESQATGLLHEHSVADAVLVSVVAYWDLRAAQESLEATSKSLELAVQITSVTRALIDAGELPAVELARAQATEARSRALVSAAERRVHDARVALATAIGVAPDGTDGSLPRAKDPFPDVAPAPLPPEAAEPLASAALTQRKDVAAAEQVARAGRALEAGARGFVPAKVDLSVSTWATSFSEPATDGVADRWTGPSVKVALDVERPVGNHEARGRLEQNIAVRRQRDIAAADLTRQVRLNVVRTTMTLGALVERTHQAAEAARASRVVVDGELERLRAHETTLIDTLFTQDQLTTALLELASAQRDLWSLVAETRFEAGTLVQGTTVVGRDLVTLPVPGGPVR